MKRSLRFFLLFCIGGGAYNLIELLWRGHTHWSMFVVGGGCFHLIGRTGNALRGHSRWLIGGACAAAVTAVEYLSGCVLNLHFKLGVWDYSHLFGNLHGQVCLLYSALWGFLSFPAVRLYRFLDRQISERGHRSQRGERASQISLPNSTNR